MVIIRFIFKDNGILIRGKIGTKRQGSSGNRGINAVVDPGDDPGGARPPSFLDQTEAQRDDKKFLLDPTPYLRVWMTGPPYLKVWMRHCYVIIGL